MSRHLVVVDMQRVVADACAGVDEASHRKTLDVLALYTPLMEIVTSADLLYRARSQLVFGIARLACRDAQLGTA